MDLSHPEKYIKYVANYIRKSRGDSDTDLDKHKEQLKEICRVNDWKYVEYLEIGSGDSIAARPKMQELLNDIEEGIYDAVCIVDYDRLGRGDLEDQGKIKKAFQKQGTYIVTPSKIYNLSDDDDEFIADVRGFLARQEYKQILKRLKQGKKFGARRGDWVSGVPPYPYEYERWQNKYNSKGLVVNDEKLKIYRMMIEMALEGDSPLKISRLINDLGIPSPRLKKWEQKTVRNLLIDETHLGKIISNKTQWKKNTDNNKYKKISNPKEDWIIIENCHEVVKTTQEHEKILSYLKSRNKIPNRAKSETYPLTGLVKCGKCESSMSFYTKKGNGQVILKPCYGKDNEGKRCKNGGKIADIILIEINNEIEKYKKKLIDKILDSKDLINSTQYMINKKNDLLIEKQKTLERIFTAYETGIYSLNEMRKKSEKVKAEINQIQTQLNLLNEKLIEVKNEDTKKFVNRISEFLEQIEKYVTNSELNQYYKTIIEKILWIKHSDKDIELKIVFKE